jgi:hypothetical protein
MKTAPLVMTGACLSVAAMDRNKNFLMHQVFHRNDPSNGEKKLRHPSHEPQRSRGQQSERFIFNSETTWSTLLTK